MVTQTTNTTTNLGVTQAVRLLFELNFIETGLGGLLVFPDLRHDLGGQDLVPKREKNVLCHE